MKQSILLRALSLCVALVCLCSVVSCDLITPTDVASEDAAEKADNTPALDLLATDTKVTTGFSVSRAFSSDMVIQRDEPLRVWGWADSSYEGKTVTGEFLGVTAESTVKNGEWEITFEPGFEANPAMGNHMTIRTDSDEVIFKNVLVGDVYMVIGQSNVAYWLQTHCAATGTNYYGIFDGDKPIRIRMNSLGDTVGYPQKGTEEVCHDVLNGRTWNVPNANNAVQFTAIGYLFAMELVERTDAKIPIGVIEIDGNGQPIGAFLPNEVAAATNSDSYNSERGIYTTAGINGDAARYMYNHHMAPYEKYALAGVVWYQGESDFTTELTNTYVEKFVGLMNYMRSTHNLKNKEFPVYIMEFPSVYPGGAYIDFGYTRAEMGSIPQLLPNSYVSVSSDLFNDKNYADNIHPHIKGPQSKRLADLACSVWYGMTPLAEATGPILKEYKVSEDRKTVTLIFDNVGEGLTTSDGGTTVKGFVPFTKFGKLNTVKRLEGEITAPDTVTLTSTNDIYGVAYNAISENYYGVDINLCNSYGRIASAFTFYEPRIYGTRVEPVDGELTPTAPTDDTIAVHFATTEGTRAIGTQVFRESGRGGEITLSLYAFDTDYATTIAAEPIRTDTFRNLQNFSRIELLSDRKTPFAAGEYLLVVSGVSDLSLKMGGTHESQVLYRGGKADLNASALITLSYAEKYDTIYAIPADLNRPAETEPPITEAPTEPVTEPITAPLATTPAEETTPVTEAETSPTSSGGCGSMLSLSALLLLVAAAVLTARRKR